MDNIQNPLLSENAFVPDAEAHVWADGKIYIYGSLDIRGKRYYCSSKYHVFSSEDMIHWQDHGVSFKSSDISWFKGICPLYAPDCAYRNGKYYLYYCIPDGRCGVASSDKPYGPFKDVGQLKGVSGIDPSVFIDDDGQAYIYWGQFDEVRGAKLNEDMVTLDLSTVTQPLSVAEHDFHEGSSVKKINGKYIYLYTDTHRHKDIKPKGMATCLGYAVSDSPLSGYEYKGVVIDNFGCDPGVWNNHGSLCNIRGQWYVFYHRSTHGTEFSRHVCAEKIDIRPDGHIDEVKMTSGELKASSETPSYLACSLFGNVRIGGKPLHLSKAKKGDHAEYRYFNFEGENSIILKGDGRGVKILIDSGEICSAKTDGTPAFFEKIKGRHTVTIEFDGCRTLYDLKFEVR